MDDVSENILENAIPGWTHILMRVHYTSLPNQLRMRPVLYDMDGNMLPDADQKNYATKLLLKLLNDE